MKQIVTIGLDAPVVEKLRVAIDANIVAYPDVPEIKSYDGQTYVASRNTAGKWLTPDGVIYYSYFENAAVARRALAISETPTFPDVRVTLPHDDKATSLAMSMRHDTGMSLRRGYMPNGAHFDKPLGQRVLKRGNLHCGRGIVEADIGPEFYTDADVVVEPLIEGTSDRILIVGTSAWHLRYESPGWIKNLGPYTVRVVEERFPTLLMRASRLAAKLNLVVCGLDFIVTDKDAFFLETNAYPGLDDVPEAVDGFVTLATNWWAGVGRSKEQ